MTEETKREPKFKIGDVVRHKASGKRAVVICLWEECVNPEHPKGFDCDSAGHKGCDMKFSGNYNLSTDIGQMSATCHEIEIENARTEQRVQNENGS